MAFFDPGPPRKEYSARALFELFELVKQCLNNLDLNNFPKGIPGSIILSGTLSGTAIPDHDISLTKLRWLEWPIPLILAPTPVTTTSTTPVNLGGYFAWNPANFGGAGKWYLEASIASANTAATATCTLKGSVDYGSVTTTSTSLVRVRSAALTMPTQAENLWITLKTSNASYAASLAAARLIFVPE